MADSKDSKNQKLSENFEDDLDSMLDDAASSTTRAEEMMGDDDDAIDQLLMSNSLNTTNDDGEDDDGLEDLFSDDSTNIDFDDEFEPSSQQDEPVKADQESDEFVEIDEFSDIDEFADEPEAESDSTQSSDDDFTVAEFDITFDDNSINEAESIADDENSIENEQSPDDSANQKVASAIDSNSAKVSGPSALDPAIALQITQLFTEQAALKQQLEQVSAKIATDAGDVAERVDKSQQALKKQVEGRIGKTPIIAYIALGVALVALLIGAAASFFGWNATDNVGIIEQRIVSLEDNQELMISKNGDSAFNEIDAKINQQNLALSALTAQLSELAGSTPEENEASPLKALNEAVSAATKQQKALVESIEALTARVQRLEAKKLPSPPKKTAAQASGSQKWSVNLVSFRQEWYANRKAAEFAKKGIQADVVSVRVKGEPWYRLTVKGFKTKAEAAAYAARMKKDFNLDSVWLGKD